MTHLDRIQARSANGRSKRNRNAVAWLQAFERRAYALMAETAETRALMSGGPTARFNDPRYERGTAVNATDIRASRAWRHSRHQADDVTVIEGLPAWLSMAFDTATIERVWPTHVRHTSMATSGPETAPKARQRKSRTGGRAALRAARMRDAAGIIRMADQD